jgi:hypothetical protein
MNDTGERLARLAQRMAHAEQQLCDHDRPARHARMRAAVLASWPDPLGTPTRRRWGWLLAMGGLLTTALVAWVVARPEPSTLRVDEPLGRGQAHLFITAGDDEPVRVSFSDESVLTLWPRARVRVEAARDAGVALVLESGTLEVALEPPAAGAWTITTMATADERRALDPAQGATTIRARPRRRSEPRGVAEPVVAEPVAVATWRDAAREGSYADAIAAAEAVGFAGLCASLDPTALLELADAGRYAGRDDRARQALRVLRRRFPGTDAAAAAAFDLGRLGARDAARCGDASQWFRVYLDERPRGSMSEAARQRIDECAERSATEPTP